MVFFMVFYRWIYLIPHFKNSTLLFSNIDFLIFVFAIVLGAGSGFMINDVYDEKIDSKNHSKNQLIGASKTVLWSVYILMNIVCGMVTLYLTFKYKITEYAIIYPISTFLLWFYSYKLKRVFLIGNLTISVLISGLVIFIFPFIELQYLNVTSSIHLKHLLFLSVLAFLLNLSREIIKDIEDRKGDSEFGCKTLPIVLGVNRTKQIVVFILGTTAFTFLYFLGWMNISLDKAILFYGLFLFCITALIGLVKFAKTNLHFHKASRLLKMVMLLGIISVILWI